MSDLTGRRNPKQFLMGSISGGSVSQLKGNMTIRGFDGISPEIDVEEIDGGIKVTIVDVNGSHSFVLNHGVSIESIEQTTVSSESDGENVITVILSDGEKKEFVFRNGAKGDKGDKGDTGEVGPPGKDGSDGKSAYQYAQDGGYEGTEEEFAEMMASGSGSGVDLDNLIVTDDDVIEMLVETDIINPVVDSNNMFYISNNNEMYVL